MAVRNVPPTNSYNGAGTATRQRDRSFAALYEQARRASTNDNANDNPDDEAPAEAKAEQNRKYIDNLHEHVDTLRGEILVRVIQSGQAQGNDAVKATGDISRLSNRLNTLRQKLQQEETRLSGKLIDVEV
jgi:hypothetical protein